MHEYRIIAYRNKDWTKVMVLFIQKKLAKYHDSSLYYFETIVGDVLYSSDFG
jgi:hypothetical protein